MNLGFITVRTPDYHPNGRLLTAARQKGCRGWLLHPYEMVCRLDAGGPGLILPPGVPLPDVVIPRLGAEISDYTLTLLEHMMLMGLPVVSSPQAIGLARSQFLSLQALSRAGLPLPETYFVNTPKSLEPALEGLGGYPVVAKTVSGRQGKGVALLENEGRLRQACEQLMETRSGMLVQRFIPPKGRRDIRVMVVGGRVLGAMSLEPRAGDFRANFHLTGSARVFEPDQELAAMALRAADALGLEIAGVDMISTRAGEPLIIEVNYAPGFKGLEAATGLDIAGAIIDYLLSRPLLTV